MSERVRVESERERVCERERGDVVVINTNKRRKVIPTISSFYFLKYHCCVEPFKTKEFPFVSKRKQLQFLSAN